MRTESGPVGRKSFIEEARRAQIAAAAVETVAAVGYANASLARIAETAGISKSVISYHFSGKHELLVLAATTFFEDAWAHMAARIDAEPTAAGKVGAWIAAEFDYFAGHRSAFLAASDIVAGHRAPDGSRPFAAAEAEEVDGLAELLAAGQAAGEFRAFDTRAVATIVIRAVEGVLGSWTLDDTVDLAAQSASLLDFVHHAIRREEP